MAFVVALYWGGVERLLHPEWTETQLFLAHWPLFFIVSGGIIAWLALEPKGSS